MDENHEWATTPKVPTPRAGIVAFSTAPNPAVDIVEEERQVTRTAAIFGCGCLGGLVAGLGLVVLGAWAVAEVWR